MAQTGPQPPDPGSGASALDRARACYAKHAWADAYTAFALADQAGCLAELEDLERLAWASALIGRDEDMLAALDRLHQGQLAVGAIASAARSAFWSGFRLLALGEHGRAGGWMSRTQRLVDQLGGECAEAGYLLLPASMRCAGSGDYASAYETVSRALELGERYGDGDLIAFARALQGRNLVRMGRLSEGLPLIDEAMLAATSGAISPIMTGLIYCSSIAGCMQAFALDRAREWTLVLERWCEAQPQIVVFTASCMVHRAELLQRNGAWTQAADEARRAVDPLRCAVERSAVSEAHYQQAEIHRLRGEDALAEEAYRQAHQLGREPQPGSRCCDSLKVRRTRRCRLSAG